MDEFQLEVVTEKTYVHGEGSAAKPRSGHHLRANRRGHLQRACAAADGRPPPDRRGPQAPPRPLLLLLLLLLFPQAEDAGAQAAARAAAGSPSAQVHRPPASAALPPGQPRRHLPCHEPRGGVSFDQLRQASHTRGGRQQGAGGSERGGGEGYQGEEVLLAPFAAAA
ncbi:hypothetical protein C4D60_Mb06t13340 [Musa balbisiana]|uniref:Uncharacterized protein n=1 Tax=Musa balbisiana TaxID=52838 RepID=A0A4S8IMR1_MUSBA|nr:hypothetical protein C4D60_Mb06t13340 [Musa balbisiana]